MLDRLFRPRKSRSRNLDVRPTVAVRLPSFRESRYSDVSEGALPAEGVLPLRGNRKSAWRVDHDDVELSREKAEHEDIGADSRRRHSWSWESQQRLNLEGHSHSGLSQYWGMNAEGDPSDIYPTSSASTIPREITGPVEENRTPEKLEKIINDLNQATLRGRASDTHLSQSYKKWIKPGISHDTQHASSSLDGQRPKSKEKTYISTSEPAGITSGIKDHLCPSEHDSINEKIHRHNDPKQSAQQAQVMSEANDVIRRAQYDSSDFTVRRTQAPAVIQEVLHKPVHEIRQERISREIHNHDVFHRILPIVDVEVLPTRHFRNEGNRLIEMRPDEVPPGRLGHWIIAETVSTGEQPSGRRRFTAREFPGTEGHMKRYTTKEGFPGVEETWIHAPELETGGQNTGQTVPFIL